MDRGTIKYVSTWYEGNERRRQERETELVPDGGEENRLLNPCGITCGLRCRKINLPISRCLSGTTIRNAPMSAPANMTLKAAA